MSLAQDRSLDLLASSQTRYHCTTDASLTHNNIVKPLRVRGKNIVAVSTNLYSVTVRNLGDKMRNPSHITSASICMSVCLPVYLPIYPSTVPSTYLHMPARTHTHILTPPFYVNISPYIYIPPSRHLSIHHLFPQRPIIQIIIHQFTSITFFSLSLLII